MENHFSLVNFHKCISFLWLTPMPFICICLGIIDGINNCPVDSNENQADFDNDGMGNECDTDDDNDGKIFFFWGGACLPSILA